MKRFKIFAVLVVGGLLFFNSCKKDTFSADSYYIPTVANVTSTATLAELQQGHDLYLSKCGACHQLYSPDSFTPSDWNSILISMAPKAKLSAANTILVAKYVSRGN
jgi:mono/diheme cytochrome c family protein